MYGSVIAIAHVETRDAMDLMLLTVPIAQHMPTGTSMVSVPVTDVGDKNQQKDAVIATHAPVIANAQMAVLDLMTMNVMNVVRMPS